MSKKPYRLKMLNDTSFKYFFANEKMKKYAEYLIDAILQHENDLLEETITIQENKSIKLSFFEGKRMEFDFLAKNTKRKINIEAENKVRTKLEYLPRIEAHASAIYLEKFKKGMDYEELLKVTSGNISEFLKAYNKAEQEDIDWNKVRENDKKEGIKEGEEKGKREGIDQIALNLKTKGYSLEEIKEVTGLSMKEIESLSKILNNIRITHYGKK
jgi:hypothetical protein